MNKTDLLDSAAEVLARHYHTPDLGNKTDPVDELIYILLCTGTGHKNVEKAYSAVKPSHKRWDDVIKSDKSNLGKKLTSVGDVERRVEQILSLLEAIKSKNRELTLSPQSELPDNELFDWLNSLPHVGTKIAHCVMLFSFNRGVLPVDTHVARILMRIGIAEPYAKPDVIAREIQQFVPKGKHYMLHVNLIAHGRKTCRAYTPNCDSCVISHLCAYAGNHILAEP